MLVGTLLWPLFEASAAGHINDYNRNLVRYFLIEEIIKMLLLLVQALNPINGIPFRCESEKRKIARTKIMTNNFM